MLWLVLSLLSLVPLVGFAITFRLSGGKLIPAVSAAGLVGALMGAFLASAGSAMATSVDPRTALFRGGGIGLFGGAALGGVAAALIVLKRRTP
jgi:hypothetical protein